MNDHSFFKEAELMLLTLPFIAPEKCFALKGGTAINLFVRNMPRLSVDVDLTYLPLESRENSLKMIGESLGRVSAKIEKNMPHVKVQPSYAGESKNIAKLIVHSDDAQIKIEPNHVLRGSVFAPIELPLCGRAQELFQLSITMTNLSSADLYGGKICAALDRQHPRDLFDIYILMQNEGITDDIRKAFVIYLAGHDRPINELIDPVRKDIKKIFENEFAGMTYVPVSYETLIDAREKLITAISHDLTNSERQFLLSVKEMNPQWDLLGLEGIDKLPSIQWKLLNLDNMSSKKHTEATTRLKHKLGM